MKVKAIGKTHVLLILTAAEAQYLGIPTGSGCAVLLQTHTVFLPEPVSKRRRYRCRMMPQVIYFASCASLLDCIERLCRLPLRLMPCPLYAMDNGYALILYPTCRWFFSLRSLVSEYGTLKGRSPTAVAFCQEHGRLLCKDALTEIGTYL
ncbi:MAG: hypothetical protein PUC32_02855 [Oscillospiraceae bacterium]|nr:hypothetical protein [Oscillospiraceae bacterium]